MMIYFHFSDADCMQPVVLFHIWELECIFDAQMSTVFNRTMLYMGLTQKHSE